MSCQTVKLGGKPYTGGQERDQGGGPASKIQAKDHRHPKGRNQKNQKKKGCSQHSRKGVPSKKGKQAVSEETDVLSRGGNATVIRNQNKQGGKYINGKRGSPGRYEKNLKKKKHILKGGGLSPEGGAEGWHSKHHESQEGGEGRGA